MIVASCQKCLERLHFVLLPPWRPLLFRIDYDTLFEHQLAIVGWLHVVGL